MILQNVPLVKTEKTGKYAQNLHKKLILELNVRLQQGGCSATVFTNI